MAERTRAYLQDTFDSTTSINLISLQDNMTFNEPKYLHTQSNITYQSANSTHSGTPPASVSGLLTMNLMSLLQIDYLFDLNPETLSSMMFYLANKMRLLFYLVWPSETMFNSLDKVPRYVAEMFPIFVLSAVIEVGVRILQGKSMIRLNESVASLSAGIFQECLRMKVRSFELIMYCLIWNNFRLMTLPWDSLMTWWLCYLSVDFGFYWAHRLAHEVNFIWAVHQAHHSSEEFNMVSALRQAVLQPFTAWFTYMPLAFFIPPQIFLAHLQLTELYMAWLHTEVVDKIGPLEYLLNTPSHHRVHHSRNPEYIDKNYGGMLIIWDRLFGTFKEEDRQSIPPVYGLVHQVKSFEPFYLQTHPWPIIWKRMKQTQGSIFDKLKVLFYKPGWVPGLGFRQSLAAPPIARPIVNYDPPINLVKKVYVLVHFAVVLFLYHELTLYQAQFSTYMINIGVLSLIVSITTLGMILDNRRRYNSIYELVRCILFFQISKILTQVIDHGLKRTGLNIEHRLFVLSMLMGLFSLSIMINSALLSWNFIYFNPYLTFLRNSQISKYRSKYTKGTKISYNSKTKINKHIQT